MMLEPWDNFFLLFFIDSAVFSAYTFKQKFESDPKQNICKYLCNYSVTGVTFSVTKATFSYCYTVGNF